MDCQVEFFPRYVQKPTAMYTFLCNEDIPRRCFETHSLLHSEALVQADYWLEQRCPLAYLGCPFSVVRLRPNGDTAGTSQPVGQLAYSAAVNTFTVRYDSHCAGGGTTGLKASGVGGCDDIRNRLERLPRELLQRIISFLDEVLTDFTRHFTLNRSAST